MLMLLLLILLLLLVVLLLFVVANAGVVDAEYAGCVDVMVVVL